MFTQGHRVAGKLELVQHSDVNLHEATQMFMVIDYVREMTVKKSCRYDEYRSLGRLLYLFYFAMYGYWY